MYYEKEASDALDKVLLENFEYWPSCGFYYDTTFRHLVESMHRQVRDIFMAQGLHNISHCNVIVDWHFLIDVSCECTTDKLSSYGNIVRMMSGNRTQDAGKSSNIQAE